MTDSRIDGIKYDFGQFPLSDMSLRVTGENAVAAIPRGGGRYIFNVVFGARPNVLPAMHNPQDGKLYLTRDLLVQRGELVL